VRVPPFFVVLARGVFVFARRKKRKKEEGVALGLGVVGDGQRR
jgi:hypothetical protein